MNAAGFGLYVVDPLGNRGYLSESGLLVEWSDEAKVFKTLESALSLLQENGVQLTPQIIPGKYTACVIEFSCP